MTSLCLRPKRRADNSCRTAVLSCCNITSNRAGIPDPGVLKERLMKKVCVLLVLIVVAAASMSAQAAPEKAGSQSARRYINLPKVVQAPFRDGVLVGNTLYLAGRLGLDPKTGKLPDDIEQEARIVLDGLKSVLTEAGMTMDDLVFVQVFCPDISLYAKFNDVYKTYFGKDYPARAFVGSGPLLRGGHFEINGIAVKR